jgi:hypothetical protein
MADFLKAFPQFTVDYYLWGLSLPMIKIMGIDASHTLYLSEKQAKEYRTWKSARNAKLYDDPEKFMNDLGLPIFK